MAKKPRPTPPLDSPSPKRGWQKIDEPGIPHVVSDRMVRRMWIFCGFPTGLGLLVFPGSYVLVQQGWKMPVAAVVALTIGCFGLGIVGLSYGILSTCWDEERVGDWLGWQELRLNWGRLRANSKANRNNTPT